VPAFLVGADFSQIELRFLAILSGSVALQEAYLQGKDVHKETAMERYGVSAEKVTTPMRNMAKRTNFGIPYGLSPKGMLDGVVKEMTNDELSEEAQEELAHVTLEDCEDFHASFHKRYPGVKEYMDSMIAFVHKTGYAVTHYGRVRHIPEIKSTDRYAVSHAERAAINMPIQGSAADLLKMAIPKVKSAVRKQLGAGPKQVLVVHDDLKYRVPSRELVEPMGAILRGVMSSIDPDLPIPTPVDVTWGTNLLHLEELEI
jgi:DNA polymerase-1